MRRTRFKEIIDTLIKGNFYAECPQCNDEVPLKRAALFDNDNFTPEALEFYQQQLAEIEERKQALTKLRERGTSKSEIGAKSVNIGLILERLAPTMGGFRFNHNDCRSLFDPIDYVIFEGLSTRGEVAKILFVEIKTGRSPLSRKQKEIRSVVQDKKVNLKLY